MCVARKKNCCQLVVLGLTHHPTPAPFVSKYISITKPLYRKSKYENSTYVYKKWMCKSALVVRHQRMKRKRQFWYSYFVWLLPPRLFIFYFAEAESENVAPPPESQQEPDTMANFDDVSVIAETNCNGKCFVNYMWNSLNTNNNNIHIHTYICIAECINVCLCVMYAI